MIVPNTALISTTTSDAISVSFIAATACGWLTASQNVDHPSSPERITTTAIGIRTMTVR